MGLTPAVHDLSSRKRDRNDDDGTTSNKISLRNQLQYARNGHAVLRSILDPETLSLLRSELIHFSSLRSLDAWRQKVEVATNSLTVSKACSSIRECQTILRRINSSGDGDGSKNFLQQPFLQHFNTWREIRSVEKFVTSPLMARSAATLMDVEKVRLYQDSLFIKRAGDGPTPFHSDARMAPFDTSNMITFWIPFQKIPDSSMGGTGLIFVDKSHADFALPFWNQQPSSDVYDGLEQRYGGDRSVTNYMPLEFGDVTVHSGFTLHCANSNIGRQSEYFLGEEESTTRYALAVTYVDARAEIRDNLFNENHSNRFNSTRIDVGHNEDQWSFQDWIHDVKPRTYFEHDLVPIVWPCSAETSISV